jgi:hypothetical protein
MEALLLSLILVVVISQLLCTSVLRLSPQFLVDYAVDESHVVHDGKMRAIPDVNLQPRIGETPPAQRVVTRYVWISASRETRDWNIPWALLDELVIAGHPEFGAHHGKHQLPKLRIAQQLISGRDVEMTYELTKDIVGLRINRTIPSELRELEQIVNQPILEGTLVGNSVGRAGT